jgi:Zn-finger nucleic acid-binding protein
MEIDDWEIIRLELKYCERCGGLWLRERGTGKVYCAACTSEVSEFSLGGRRISRPRLPTNGTVEIESQDGAVRFIVCEGRGDA